MREPGNCEMPRDSKGRFLAGMPRPPPWNKGLPKELNPRTILCPHGVLGRSQCNQCRAKDRRESYRRHPERDRQTSRRWRSKDPEKWRAITSEYNRKYCLKYPEKTRIRSQVNRYPDLYPLANECVFCGRTENLQHGHLDYEDGGYNYVTVCPQCNCWMDKS